MEEKTTLTKIIENFSNIVKDSSYEGMVYLTGSCIRNGILSKELKTVEIVVDQKEKSISFARWLTQVLGCYIPNSNPLIDLQKGIATFQILNNPDFNGITFTCKSARKLLYVNGKLTSDYHAGTIKEDYKQRDVTINAIYYDLTNQSILDVEGQSVNDLKNKILRCPSDPNVIFRNDPIKILRIIRLSAETGFGIDKDTWLSMIENSNKVNNLEQEVITKEVNKMLLFTKPSIIIRKMLCCNNILKRVLPSVYDLKFVQKSIYPPMSLLNFTLKVVDNSTPTVEHRLAALYHAIGEIGGDKKYSTRINASESCQIAELALLSMKYKKATVDTVTGAILLQNTFNSLQPNELPSNKSLRDMKKLCGDCFDFVLDTIDAINKSDYPSMKSEQIKEIREKVEKLQEKDKKHIHETLQINGNDIVNEFKIKPGELVGELMSKLRKEHKKRGFMTRTECLDFINSELILMDAKN